MFETDITETCPSNIAQGLLRPKEGNRIQYVNELSCDIIHTLETDVNEARIFIDQLRNGTVPTIIANFPQDTFQDLKDLVNILYTLPTEIISSAEAAVTDAASLFGDIEDGAIIKDIENVPSAVVSDITNGWSDLTNEITSAWGDITSEVACLFESCPQPTTARACPVDAAAATTTGAGAAATAGQDTAQGTSQSQAQPTGATNLASTRSKWAGQGVLVTAAVAVFAGSLFL